MSPEEIFNVMGQRVVLLRIARKDKKPIDAAWEQTTLDDMTPVYLASLNGDTNIGILHGAASGYLIGIEFDSAEAAREFWKANPWVKDCLWSKAVRGPCFWVFIEGDYPKSHNLYDKAGNQVGEWRADGRQTVFSGVHPTGKEYHCSVQGKPARLRYADIVWPDTILTAKPEPEVKRTLNRRDQALSDIMRETGNRLFTLDQDGKVSSVNQRVATEMMARTYDILFELIESRFYLYNETTGAWDLTHPETIKGLVADELRDISIVANVPSLLKKITTTTQNGITEHLQSHTARNGAFKRLTKVIHCKNGMLHIEANGTWELKEFSPTYYSRNPVPVKWNPDAVAPKFSAILAAMRSDDSGLILRYCGNILLGGNPSQQILLLVGEGGTSKSTLCEIIELLLGRRNVAELRTQFLHERFEIGRYIGKLLLSGKDVTGDFLMTEGAQALKKLTGHDNLTGEIKFSMLTPEVYGDFPALITCNERLLIRLEGELDVSAWARRLMMIVFGSALKHKETITNYAQKLVEEEGEGILRLMVEGAIGHLQELDTLGHFAMSQEQRDRIDALLAESQSLERFVIARVFKNVGGDGISTEELTTAYSEFCEEKGWASLEIKKVQRDIPDLMLRFHGAHLGNSISRDKGGKSGRVRGYANVSLLQPADDDGSYSDGFDFNPNQPL